MVGKKPREGSVTLRDFAALVTDVKDRIQSAQARAVLAVNAELVRLYWDIGRIIDQRQKREGWGAAVIPRLALELKNELPELKGFSERNIKRMLAFHRMYPNPEALSPPAGAMLTPGGKVPQAMAQTRLGSKVPQAVALLQDGPFWSVPWAHHVILMEKVKDLPARRWYMEQTLANGWSRYVFAFLPLPEPFQERELETELVRHLEKFLLELGQGFSFVGRQYRLDVGDDDFYIDLLFYHLRLRAFVVIKHATAAPTIGLILCQTR